MLVLTNTQAYIKLKMHMNKQGLILSIDFFLIYFTLENVTICNVFKIHCLLIPQFYSPNRNTSLCMGRSTYRNF